MTCFPPLNVVWLRSGVLPRPLGFLHRCWSWFGQFQCCSTLPHAHQLYSWAVSFAWPGITGNAFKTFPPSPVIQPSSCGPLLVLWHFMPFMMPYSCFHYFLCMTLPFHLSLYMDASILGLDIILSKGLGHDNGSSHMAATISPTKANYTMTELEALAIVWGTDVPPLPILSTLHLGHRSSRLVRSLLPWKSGQ